MTTTPKHGLDRFTVNEERLAKLRRIAREANARLGIPEKPSMTHDELMASMLASGIRPEDNILSRELLRMRYGDDYDQDKYMRSLDMAQDKEQQHSDVLKCQKANRRD